MNNWENNGNNTENTNSGNPNVNNQNGQSYNHKPNSQGDMNNSPNYGSQDYNGQNRGSQGNNGQNYGGQGYNGQNYGGGLNGPNYDRQNYQNNSNYNGYDNNNDNNRRNNNQNNNRNNQNNNKKQKNFNTILILAIAAVLTFIGFSLLRGLLNNVRFKEISYTEFLQMVEDDKIAEVKFDADRIVITPTDETNEQNKLGKIKYTYYTAYVNDDELVSTLKKNPDITISGYIPDSSASMIEFLAAYILPLLIMIFMFTFIYRKISSGGGMMGGMGVGKNTAKVYVQKQTGVTFKDVAGQDEAKESLKRL